MRDTNGSKAPHIASGESSNRIQWTVFASLLPAAFAALIFFPLQFLSTLTGSWLGAFAAHTAGNHFFARPAKSALPASLITGLLLALFLSPGISLVLSLAAGFLAVFLGREIFGGLGANPFNPAMLGLAFAGTLTGANFFPPAYIEAWPFAVIAALGGLFLLRRKLIQWDAPCLFLFVLFSVRFLFSKPLDEFFSGVIWLGAFFVITDPVTTPLTRRGKNFSAMVAAALTGLLELQNPNKTFALSLSVLSVNAVTPWIDAYFSRPQKGV